MEEDRVKRMLRQSRKLEEWESKKVDQEEDMKSYAVWLSLKGKDETSSFEEWHTTWRDLSKRRIEYGIWASMQEQEMKCDFGEWVWRVRPHFLSAKVDVPS